MLLAVVRLCGWLVCVCVQVVVRASCLWQHLKSMTLSRHDGAVCLTFLVNASLLSMHIQTVTSSVSAACTKMHSKASVMSPRCLTLTLVCHSAAVSLALDSLDIWTSFISHSSLVFLMLLLMHGISRPGSVAVFPSVGLDWF